MFLSRASAGQSFLLFGSIRTDSYMEIFSGPERGTRKRAAFPTKTAQEGLYSYNEAQAYDDFFFFAVAELPDKTIFVQIATLRRIFFLALFRRPSAMIAVAHP